MDRDMVGILAAHLRPWRSVTPAPGVPEPYCRQQMQGSGIGPTIDDRGSHQHVVHILFRILDEDVEIAALVEDAGIDQLILLLPAATGAVHFYELLIRILRMRVLIQEFHVRVRRRGIEVIVILLDVLAVIAFRPAQAEQAFLQNPIASIPEREREAQALVVIADAAEPVLGPAISPHAGMVMREVLPGGSILAVILARIAPRALGQIRSPAFPVLFIPLGFFYTLAFRGHRHS